MSNAFNIDRDWYDDEVIGIDLGMALLAIENYKTGMIWKLLNSNINIKRGIKAAMFKSIR